MAREMFVLGIDVSKDSLMIFDTGSKSHVTVPNTAEALTEAAKVNHWSAASHVAGLESTGDYSLLAMKTLVELGFQVRLLNPILTQSGIKRTIRGLKTDATDSELIAELTLKGEGQLVTENALNIEKKATMRVERKLTNLTKDLKRLTAALEQKAEAGVNIQAAKSIVNELIDELEDAKVRLWEEIRGQQDHLQRQEEIIGSHIGCGVKLATIISEESGDIKRFDNPRQLVAYAGIDPKVIQSGAMDARGRMTKRGNSNLRHALYLAAQVAARFDPQLKAYFEQKRKDGKHYTVAVNAVARKMCERIYATVKADRLYEKREPVVKEQSLISNSAA
jgi:transposase